MSLKFVKTEHGTCWHWLHDGVVQCLSHITTKPTQEVFVDASSLLSQISHINRVVEEKRLNLADRVDLAEVPRLYLDGGEQQGLVCTSCLPSLLKFLIAKTTEQQLFPVKLTRQRPDRVWHWRQRRRQVGRKNEFFEDNHCGCTGFNQNFCSTPSTNISLRKWRQSGNSA